MGRDEKKRFVDIAIIAFLSLSVAVTLNACGNGDSDLSVQNSPPSNSAALNKSASNKSSTPPANATILYVSPTGSGAACSQGAPCGLSGAQQAVKAQLSAGALDVAVQLADGTYRLANTWSFGAADSGKAGHPVIWYAAPGAHPVISGATQVTGWSQVGTSGVWAASVPANSNTRQLYVNGAAAPIAQQSPGQLGFKGGWAGSATGYDISADSAAMAWFAKLSAAQVASIEFDYPGGNGQWTESRCRVASYSGGKLVMAQPCWTNTTNRAGFSQASGGLPSMGVSTMPTLVQNAVGLVQPGQWFLDSTASTLYYVPASGQQMAALDIELPQLESLLQGAGTLANPLHDVTFSGLQFSYATWNDPSTNAGFADVQSNLRMTVAGGNQGLCTFSSPAGSCPWGALTQPLANVSFSASNNITFSGNRFANLGGAGLAFMYGSSNNLIQGNEFTAIASTGILLGCTYDPTPGTTYAAAIKQNCNPVPALVANDTVGTNEIMTGNTISNNVIHHIGTDYSSACGITLLFSQGTTITQNHIYDVPYSAITAGVVQGHVDNAPHPQNSVNINANNTISNNLLHDYLQVLADGGAIYIEGHQAQYYYKADGVTIDPVATLAHGMQVTGNVAFNGRHNNNTFYDDAGSEWINWQGNVDFSANGSTQGGCQPTGHFWVTGNYASLALSNYGSCSPGPTDVNASGNTTISTTPGPGDIPASLLSGAGLTSAYQSLAASVGSQMFYASGAGGSGSTQVLVAGVGFSSDPPVYFNGVKSTNVQYLSDGFLIADIPAGSTAANVSVGSSTTPLSGRINDDNPQISYSAAWQVNSNRGLGDYLDDVHYATANNATVTLTFTGMEIQVFGEMNTDQGNLGISIDGGTQQTVSTVSTDGQRHANVAIYTSPTLTSGQHTIVVTKLSGTYATIDGFNINTLSGRINDDNSRFAYAGGWTYAANRGAYGDYLNDIHYATANNAAVTLAFTGTGIQVFGEMYTDQGNLGISVDGGAQQAVSTVSTDGLRHANVAVYTSPTLASGQHTITVTKLSGQYATFDGVNITP
ncbi:MAG: right-handed parallel beta-helix repeat-containing protein [Collimonas sp.]|uniref:right-handed parallel beta-helix repeat-containing protein n=1 Tax=Collimonas sp. TaxID=1963772 RepID=UPI003265A0B6